MNRGERRRRERAVANGQLLPEQKERIRDQQQLPDDQPTPKTPDPEPVSPRVSSAIQKIGQRFITLEERAKVRKRQKKLPKDHTSTITRKPRYTMAHEARPVLNAINRSGLVPILEHRLRNHPGRPSRISITALLLCMVLNAELNATYMRADICSVFNGLDPQIGYELGLWDPDGFTLISYTMVAKQVKRLERALEETWVTSDNVFCTVDWFCHTFIKATIPRRLRRACASISLDWSSLSTYARTRTYISEETAREQQDEQDETQDSEPGVERGADTHARAGYQTATNKRKAGKFVGYNAFISTLAPNYYWAGQLDEISIGETPPPFITGIAVIPANAHIGPPGLNTVLNCQDILPELEQAIVDPGFSEKLQNFNRPLHQMGIDVVMEYGKGKVPKSAPIKAGRPVQQVIAYAGMILAKYTPQHLLSISKNATYQEIEENSADLFKYRWTPIAILPDGSIRFRCPQCGGKVKTNAKTRAHYNKDGTLKRHLRKPDSTGPFVGPIDDEYCCQGTVTIPVDKLDTYQRIPWGTPAWFARYGRRNQIENVNGMIKDRHGLQDGWCRVLNQTGNTLGLLFLAIAHNLRERNRYEHRQQQTTAHQQPVDTETPPNQTETAAQAVRGPP